MAPSARLVCLVLAVGMFGIAVGLLLVERDVTIDEVRFECASVLRTGDDPTGHTMLSDQEEIDELVDLEGSDPLEDARAERVARRDELVAGAEHDAVGLCDRNRTKQAGLVGLLAFPAGVCATLAIVPWPRPGRERRPVK